MKNKTKSKIQKPTDWPLAPQSLQLSLTTSITFVQTGIRDIPGKPPFLRFLVHSDVMCLNGISADQPMLLENDGKSIVLHCWPVAKINKNEFAVDDTIINYLHLRRGCKIIIKPVDKFLNASKILVSGNNVTKSVCGLLNSIYDGLVVKKNSVVFYGNKTFAIYGNGINEDNFEEECEYLRINKGTKFLEAEIKETNIPTGLNEQFERIQKIIDERKRKAILIAGPSSCGKSMLLKAIMYKNTKLSFCLHSLPSLLSNSYGTSERTLRNFKDYDVLLLENAEVISNDEMSRRLIASIEYACEHIMTIITTSDLDAFPKSLCQSNRISEIIEIQTPTPQERYNILKSLTQNYTQFTDEDIKEASKSSTGFVGGDLERLLSESIIENTTLTESLKKVKPISLKYISLEVPEVHWNDIGGYELVKSQLRESVTLPLENPECFTRMGIRPPRGVLLFGPPGCSKTLMAKAIATESKMNFIAVKGPELFNKFVGESEKSVSRIFKKARACAPSIIFFDEIDAMATKRGASGDSGSNVTDRVLTQLLTEIDGISTLFQQSVVIIGATNRPDLLDNALLRPGRFDRLIYVSLPDEEARKEIFKVHLRNMNFSSDIDIDQLAKRTEGYSGAEISGICRESAMNALREDPPATIINQNHINQALNAMKPRTSPSLISFYKSFEQQRKY